MEDMEVDFAQGMERVEQVVQSAQKRYRNQLEAARSGDSLINRERYVRYLSVQYHLQRDIQRQYFRVASHSDLRMRRGLRAFLVAQADLEEFRFEEAAEKVVSRGESILPAPLDVQLWHAYFDALAEERPFLRLGAACVLERVECASADLFREIFSEPNFLRPSEPGFFARLRAVELEERHLRDLEEGAIHAATLYLRTLQWALHGITL